MVLRLVFPLLVSLSVGMRFDTIASKQANGWEMSACHLGVQEISTHATTSLTNWTRHGQRGLSSAGASRRATRVTGLGRWPYALKALSGRGRLCGVEW